LADGHATPRPSGWPRPYSSGVATLMGDRLSVRAGNVDLG
jgi:hypothetical protein